MQLWFSLTVSRACLACSKSFTRASRSVFEFAKIDHLCEPDAAAASLSNSVVWRFLNQRKAQTRPIHGFPADLQRDLLPHPSFYRSRSSKALKICFIARAKPMSRHREWLHRLLDQSVLTDVAMCSHMPVLKHDQEYWVPAL